MPGGTLEPRKGTYLLWLHLQAPRRLRIGRLAEHGFEAGFYAYVGSAMGPGGVRARLGRHLGGGRRPRWHIDYLRAVAEVDGAWFVYGEICYEHLWATVLRNIKGSNIPLPGFGSSDCPCNTHLFLFQRKPSLAVFRRRLPPPAPRIHRISPVL